MWACKTPSGGCPSWASRSPGESASRRARSGEAKALAERLLQRDADAATVWKLHPAEPSLKDGLVAEEGASLLLEQAMGDGASVWLSNSQEPKPKPVVATEVTGKRSLPGLQLRATRERHDHDVFKILPVGDAEVRGMQVLRAARALPQRAAAAEPQQKNTTPPQLSRSKRTGRRLSLIHISEPTRPERSAGGVVGV